MKKTAVLLLGLFISASAHAATYKIDPAHTYPNFTISHLGFSTMHGRFDNTTGMVELDLSKKTGSVEVTIATDSVTTGFAKRDEHLRSPDFFNAMEFPEMTFKSTKVTFTSDNTAKVDGKLTILGVTKNVTLDVSSIVCGAHPFNKKELCGFNATAAIKRSDFGMKYGLPAVGDTVNISLEAEAYKQ